MKTLMRRTSVALAMAYSATATAQNPPVQQATGTIAGVVRDRDTRTPIEGVQVFVQGGAYGTMTKANGTYTILGVPPGTYTIVARHFAYYAVETTNVVVRADVRRELNVELSASAVRPTTSPTIELGHRPVVHPVQPQIVTPPGAVTIIATTTTCPTGPGARFGITGVQSASMSWRREGSQTIYSFQSEPVVVEVESWSVLKPGDVIQSVNGEPITTRAGAVQFGSPPSDADVVIAVRRNGERVELVAPTCAIAQDVPRAGTAPAFAVGGRREGNIAFGGSSASGRGGRVGGAGGVGVGASAGPRTQGGGGGGVAGGAQRPPARDTSATVTVETETIPAKPGDLATDNFTLVVPIESYGVLLACTGGCMRMRTRDGSLYWRFAEAPVIRLASLPNPRDFTQADVPTREAITRGRRAGLHPGGRIERVNGKLATSEEGSKILTFPREHYPLVLDIVYGNEQRRVTLTNPNGGAR